jgi:hypothetical protein
MDQLKDKQTQVVLFSSTAIALYGYDQGMAWLCLCTFVVRETEAQARCSDETDISFTGQE